jgi:hypothetical protein
MIAMRCSKNLTALALLGLVLLARPAWAATYWVAISGGNDGNSCAAAQNRTTPRQHIANGMSCLSGGDTLVVQNGTYTEGMENIIPSGPDSAHPTIVKAENRLGALIQPGTNLSGNANLLSINGGSNITVEGFTFDATGGNSLPVYNIVIVRPPSSNVTLQYNEIRNLAAQDYGTNGGTGVDIEDGVTQARVAHNEIHHIAYGFNDNHVHGFYISSQNSVYEFNHIHHFQAYGFQQFTTESNAAGNIYRGNLIHDSTTRAGLYLSSANNTQAYNNVIYAVPAQGIRLGPECGGGCDNGQVYNNTIVGTGGACLEINGNNSNTKVRNNICWNTSGNIADTGTGTVQDHNLLGTNPLFVNEGAHDYHLAAGSPALNAGVTLGTFNTDADGVTRPQGSAWDIGAYEGSGGGVEPPPTPSPIPIGWWKFDEGTGSSAADFTGNGNTLTFTTSPGPTWQAGRVGAFSLHCGGDGGYAQDATPFATATNQYTLTTWLKGATAPGGANEHALMNGLTNETWGFSWGHGDAAFRQAWQHRDNNGNYYAAKVTTPLVGGVWYHLAASYDGSAIRMYLNGVLQATTPVPSEITAAGAFTVCGSGVDTPFAGNLDHTKVWNRQLSDAEVRQEFSSTAGTVHHKAPPIR